jgi:hypothetical protein
MTAPSGTGSVAPAQPTGLLPEGDFQTTPSDWHFTDGSGLAVTSGMFVNGEACFTLDRPTYVGWPVVAEHALALSAGKSYLLSYDARTTLPDDTLFFGKVGAAKAPFSEYVEQERTLTTQMARYSHSFIAGSYPAGVVLWGYSVGATVPTVCVDNVSVVPLP